MTLKEPRPYVNPYVGGALLGVVLFLSFYITGNGLGASGAIGHVQVAILGLFAPDHVDRVAYFAEMGGGTRNSLDNAGVFMLLGTFLGGAISGAINRRFRVETRRGPGVSVGARWAFALLGGAIKFEGEMLDPPMFGKALQVLLRAHALRELSEADTDFALRVLGMLPAQVVRENWPYGVIL